MDLEVVGAPSVTPKMSGEARASVKTMMTVSGMFRTMFT